jgi:hypothetical protein
MTRIEGIGCAGPYEGAASVSAASMGFADLLHVVASPALANISPSHAPEVEITCMTR